MATAAKKQKVVLSRSRDIPFNKLMLSQANVRRVRAGVSIEDLAEDIARRTLVQGLSVRAVLDANGEETGMFEVPAGGRRFRALELLVKQKRLPKTEPVPCIVRTEGIAEEDSLAENVQRAPLHPLDQFRAFLTLREKGQTEEEIAAAFFVSVNVVKQRLKLASVSPTLLDVYAEDGMTLDQLMAFTVSGDPARQEQVFEQFRQGYDKSPYIIRRMLTEGAVRASDKRAQFIGPAAYEAAGGVILRDLFQSDDGGWLQDATLVDKLVDEKLAAQTATIAAEGWKWTEVAADFPYGHAFGLRRLRGEPAPLTEEEETARDALQAEFDRLSDEYADADELPDAVDERFGELETALADFDNRPQVFDPEDVARAGAFISIDGGGGLRVERGYVRPEDEAPVEPAGEAGDDAAPAGSVGSDDAGDDAAGAPDPTDPDADDGPSMPDRLIAELTAHRTLGLRQALGDQPDVAFLAALHALTLKVFYHYGLDTCLEVNLKTVGFGPQATGLNDSATAEAIRVRHETWANALPDKPEDLWDALQAWDSDSRSALFAHVVSLSVNAVNERWNRRPRALAHADQLAQAVGLDMAAAGWRATVDSFFGRVTKAQILRTVGEAKGETAAERIAHLKKGDMAAEAETLVADSGWLPELMRTPGAASADATGDDAEPAAPVDAAAAADTVDEDRVDDPAPDAGQTPADGDAAGAIAAE